MAYERAASIGCRLLGKNPTAWCPGYPVGVFHLRQSARVCFSVRKCHSGSAGDGSKKKDDAKPYKQIKEVGEYELKESQEFLQRKLFSALHSPIAQALTDLDKNVTAVGAVYKTDVCVVPGLYLNVSVRRHEPVLQYPEARKIAWVTMREEPIIYALGRPFSLRHHTTLNVNLDNFIGIEGFDLESMEMRLKSEIVETVVHNEHQFHYVHQTETMENLEMDHPIAHPYRDIITPKEMFYHWTSAKPTEKGPRLRYFRIPITDECAPDDKAFDDLVNLFQTTGPDCALVFNCQMGRGRTTTGLVCATLLAMHEHEPEGDPIFPAPGEIDDCNPNLANGEYSIIRKLCKSIPNGHVVKAEVDRAIDSCSQMQNLREAILDSKRRAELQELEKYTPSLYNPKMDSVLWSERGHNYLERYYYLILFNAYLHNQAPVEFRKSFTEWMKNRWGLKRLTKELRLA